MTIQLAIIQLPVDAPEQCLEDQIRVDALTVKGNRIDDISNAKLVRQIVIEVFEILAGCRAQSSARAE